MEKQDFTTTFLADQTPEEVFDAVLNVREWWSGKIAGKTQKLNDEFTYEAGDMHFSKQKLTELIPGKKLVWLVTDSKLSFTKDPGEWTGTALRFDISAQGGKTKLQFTHQGLVPAIECYDACSNAWSQIVQQSLQSLVTTGKGVKIF